VNVIVVKKLYVIVADVIVGVSSKSGGKSRDTVTGNWFAAEHHFIAESFTCWYDKHLSEIMRFCVCSFRQVVQRHSSGEAENKTIF